jgi:heat shock protein HslJ
MRIILCLWILSFGCRPSNQIGEMVGAINDRPLEGTVWMLVELNGKDISTVESIKPISVLFQKEGKKVSGFAGCNSFTGSYETDGATISATLASTRMFCEGKMEIETEFLKVLNTPYKHKVEGGHLYFRDKNIVVARFLAEIKTPQ